MSLQNNFYLCVPIRYGTMAEWLGNGLQNRVQQFDSAWYLKKGRSRKSLRLLPFLRYRYTIIPYRRGKYAKRSESADSDLFACAQNKTRTCTP